MKRAALYCRVSTIDQHPETQLSELRQFAANKGFQAVALGRGDRNSTE
jgi:DNA invertase Pin-like site-specific DNA recombinase